ncbi:MAG: DUF459 domain-containing protein, partial [Thermodesulfobacteriota bacterium]
PPAVPAGGSGEVPPVPDQPAGPGPVAGSAADPDTNIHPAEQAPKPEQSPPPAEVPETPVKIAPKTVLVAGDSMILEGFGPALQRALKKYPGLKVAREGKYSSGLSRPDYFDWQVYIAEILDKHNPDVLILSLGANDPQDIVDADRKRHFVASEPWNEIYGARARELLKVPEARGILTFWVGLPIMGPAKYSPRIKNINDVVQKECEANPKCVFVDTWLVLAGADDKYTTFLKDDQGRHLRVRAKDNIHLTNEGGDIMVQYFLDAVDKYIAWPEAEPGTTVAQAAPPAGFYNSDGELKDPAPNTKVWLGAFDSKSRGKKTSYYAFIPETGADGPQTFPVLYLLHGAWDGFAAWKEHAALEIAGLAQKYGLIIVTPDGDPFGWYADSPFDPANRIETYFLEELIPHVEANLPARKDLRAVAGLSMGGHGAFVLSLRHPGLFTSFSSMSGVMDITRHPDQWQLARVFGRYDEQNRELWRSHSVLFLSQKNLDYLKTTPFMFSCGAGDHWVVEENRQLSHKLKELGFDPDYRESEGNHDWKYWKAQLPEHAAFHAQVLSGAAQTATVQAVPTTAPADPVRTPAGP